MSKPELASRPTDVHQVGLADFGVGRDDGAASHFRSERQSRICSQHDQKMKPPQLAFCFTPLTTSS